MVQGAPETLPPETPLEKLDPGLLPREPQDVLRPTGVSLDHGKTSLRKRTGDSHPSYGQHPHGSEGEREEGHLASEEFPVAFPKVGARAVLNGLPPTGKRQGSVDHDQPGPGLLHEIQDLLVRVKNRGSKSARAQ